MEELNQVKIRDWYKNKLIKYNIFPLLKNRTVDFITPREIVKEKEIKRSAFRYINIKSFTGIDFNIEKGEVVEQFRNVYCSVATLNDTFEGINIVNRVEEKDLRKAINENFEKYVIGYDLKIDIDNSNLVQAHTEAVRVAEILDSYEVPYYVIFSGNKGFNFTVDTSFIPEDVAVLDRPEYFKKIVEFMKNKEKLDSIDLEVYTIGRVFKVPYSIERHYDLVALPLDRSQLKNFNVDEMKIDYCVKNLKLMNRSLLTRKGNTKGVKKFFEAYTEKVGFFGKIKKAWGEA